MGTKSIELGHHRPPCWDKHTRTKYDYMLGPPVVPFPPSLGEGSPTKTDYRKKGTLILTSLLEDLDMYVLRK